MDILLTGSVAYDYLMTFPGLFKEQILPERLESISLSFLVESMSRQRGGVAPNIAYTLALLGAKPRVMATVGEDFEDYRAWLEKQGVDKSKLTAVSYGENQPVEDNSTAEGRSQNRRIEIRMRPVE